MKQKEFFGKGEKHVYVRKGDKGEIPCDQNKARGTHNGREHRTP